MNMNKESSNNLERELQEKVDLGELSSDESDFEESQPRLLNFGGLTIQKKSLEDVDTDEDEVVSFDSRAPPLKKRNIKGLKCQLKL